MLKKLKNFINSLFDNYKSIEERDKIETAFAIKNVKIGRILMPFVASFELVLIIITLSYGNFLNTPNIVYLINYIILFVVTILAMLGSSIYKNDVVKNAKKINAVTISYSLVIICWSIIVSCLDLMRGGSYVVFLTVTMAIGCGLCFKPKVIFLIEFVSYVIFFVVVIIFAEEKGLDLFVNLTIFSLILLLITALKSMEKISSIKKSIIIEAKNEELLILNKKLEKTSLFDKLTGIKNRWSLSLTLSNKYEVAKANGHKLIVAMLDLDNFKEINDTYGHNVGDECLLSVVSCLKKYADEDCLFRYGGEEFTIVLVDKDIEDITKFLNSAREEVERIQHTDKQLNLTISGGVVIKVPDSGICEEDYLKISDRALYEAKACGKNQIIIKEID